MIMLSIIMLHHYMLLYTWRQFTLNIQHDKLLLYTKVSDFAAFNKDIIGAKS